MPFLVHISQRHIEIVVILELNGNVAVVGAVVEAGDEAIVEPCRLTIALRFVPCVSMRGALSIPRGGLKVERTFREW